MDDVIRKNVESLPFVRSLPDDTRLRILDRFKEEEFTFGETMVKQGDPADSFYLIVSGKARVLAISENGSEIPLRTIGPGDCFGELALLKSGKRSKSVRASDHVHVLSLSAQDFNEIIAQNSEVRGYLELLTKNRRLENFLRQYSTFGKISTAFLENIVKCLRPVSFKSDDLIIREGDPAGPMYIIEEGHCRVYRNEGESTTNIAYLRHGDFFGELSLLKGVKRMANVQAISDCTLLSLSPEDFDSIMRDHIEMQQVVKDRLLRYQTRKDSVRLPLDVAKALEEIGDESNENINPELHQSGLLEDSGDDGFIGSEIETNRNTKKVKRRFQFIQQIDEADCGAAALGMICRYYGCEANLSFIRDLCCTNINGTTLNDLCHAGEKLGLLPKAVKLSFRNLNNIQTPAIIHWQNDHWIVLIRISKDYLEIADPASCTQRITAEQFEIDWTGYAVLFDEVEKTIQIKQDKGFLSWILPHLKQFQWPIIKALVISLGIFLLQSLFPALTQIIVDDVMAADKLNDLNAYVMSLGAVLALTLLLMIGQRHTITYIAGTLDGKMLSFIVDRLLRLPISYFQKRTSEDIQRRLEGAREIRRFIVHSVIGGMISLIQLLVFSILMAIYSIKMTMIFFVVFPIYVGLMFFSAKILKPAFNEIQTNEIKYQRLHRDIARGIHVIKGFGSEQSFKKKIVGEYMMLADSQRQSQFNIFCYEGTIQTLGFLSTILFLWIGAKLVILDELTMGKFIAFQMLIAMSYFPIIAILNTWQDMQLSSVLVNRINDVITRVDDPKTKGKNLLCVSTLQGIIEFRNVDYSFSGSTSDLALENISFTAYPGQLIGIVGKSGSGRSTLAKCIASLIEPTSGQILFDDVERRTLDLESIRKYIGYVSGSEYVFSGSVTENIAIGDPNPDIERVIRAAKIANAHNFISELPQKYETKIRDVELHLAQGEKQSIAIARVVYKDLPVIILDEATSSMDFESEKTVLENLEHIRQERVVFNITHRLETIKHADMVLVIEGGRVIERGKHDELIQRRGIYYQFYNG